MSCFCLQVLEYEGTYESGTWTKIGELEIRRYNPAIAEANLAAFDCDIIAGSGGGSPHLHTQIVQQPSLVFCWLLALVAWLWTLIPWKVNQCCPVSKKKGLSLSDLASDRSCFTLMATNAERNNFMQRIFIDYLFGEHQNPRQKTLIRIIFRIKENHNSQ